MTKSFPRRKFYPTNNFTRRRFFVEQHYNFDFNGTLITSPQDDDNDECEDFETVSLDNEDAKASNAVNDEEEWFDWDLSVEMPVVNIISSETDSE